MAKTHTLLQVFVASPGDVADERALLAEVLTEFNNTWGNRNRVTLELLRWETHSTPAFGEDGQNVINNQIGDEYDIFIGIMWGRFGSPTKRAESGTEEEFNRAYARLSEEPGCVQIMFYFKDAGIPPSKIDATQLQKVQEFKEKISDQYGGLYHTFETLEQFQSSVRMHLSRVVQDWLDVNAAGASPAVKEKVNPPADNSIPNDPLANLSALETEVEEEGFIELVELANETMAEVTSVVERMTEATNDLSEKFTQLTAEANDIFTGGPDMKAAKRVSNKAANHLEVFVKRMSVEIVEFNKQSSRAMDTFGNIAMIAENDLQEGPEDLFVARTNMQAYTTAISTSAESLREFRETIFRLPRMTTSFNRARKRAVAVMDDLLTQLRIAASQSQEVDNLLARLETSVKEAQ